tara:strand:+ start:510 stop:629 length:120 start_codon:yes stop_codon:yes gene_type:complete
MNVLIFSIAFLGYGWQNPGQTGKQWKNNFKKVKSGLSIF